MRGFLMTHVTLDVQNMDCFYGDRQVLERINLSIQKGDFIGIVGPNGSGKSTFLKVISRTLKPKSGVVYLDGEDIQRLSPRFIARNLAVVPQETSIAFAFTALDIVLMGRSPYLGRFETEGYDDLSIARAAMEKTNTWHLAERSITSLSGGEKQRVIIAQALAQEPCILLLDEPTSHLDINHQLEIMDLVKGLNGDGLTVISVFHDLNMAAEYCRSLVLLNQGRIDVLGPPEEVLTVENIKRVFNADVLVNRHPLTKKLYVTLLPKLKRVSAVGSLKVHLICGDGTGALLMRELKNRNFWVSAGVLNVLDSDEEVANSLEIPIVAEAPFSGITDEAYRRNLDLIFQSDLVVVTNIPFGPGNIGNLHAAEEALNRGIPVILMEETEIGERDYTGGEAERMVKVLKEKGALVGRGLSEVLTLIERRAGEHRG
ncbi:MAG: heme ABC transporter ATP-binding protein [Actinomycetota bacterium]|nr:heme ABC transporter ATP-binding protein [Actinomycetota bacterium]MDI6822001.1 heme ABC transporter ATP-binding protein [Actinomycetota bacterium]